MDEQMTNLTEKERIAFILSKSSNGKNEEVLNNLAEIMAVLSAEECEKIADFARQIVEAAKKEEEAEE